MCLQINTHVNHSSRLEIIHFLFGIAVSDNEIHFKKKLKQSKEFQTILILILMILNQ